METVIYIINGDIHVYQSVEKAISPYSRILNPITDITHQSFGAFGGREEGKAGWARDSAIPRMTYFYYLERISAPKQKNIVGYFCMIGTELPVISLLLCMFKIFIIKIY